MTLPKGFGSSDERCKDCNHRVSRFDNECQYCKENKGKILLPISKMDIGISIFLITHFSSIIWLIYGIITADVFGIIFGPFSIGIGVLIIALAASDNYRHGDRIRNRCFFIYIPIAKLIKKFKFSSVDD